MFRSMGYMICEEGLRKLGFSLAKRRPRQLRGSIIVTYIYTKRHTLLSSKR